MRLGEVAAAIRGLRPRQRIVLRVAAALLAAVSVIGLALTGTARGTVLSRGYYVSVLDHEHAFTRLYDEVLVDPASAPVTRDLLAHLPVPPSRILSNLKIILPPATLRRLVDSQIGHAVDYLRGDRATPGFRIDLRPVIANLSGLAQVYLGDLVASLQNRPSPDFAAFAKRLHSVLDGLAAGRAPSGLPTLKLGTGQRDAVLRALLSVVPHSSREKLRPVVAASLALGDVGSALAEVGPFVLGDRADVARRDLLQRTDAGHWDVVPDLRHAGSHITTVKTVRTITEISTWPVQAGAVLLGLVAFAFLWISGSAATGRRMTELGAVLVASGLGAFGILLVVRWRLHDLVPKPPASWPPSLRTLVGDLQHRAASVLFSTGVIAAAVPAVVGLVVIGSVLVWRRVESRRRVRVPRRMVLAGAASLVLVALLGGTITPALSRADATQCLGSVALCDLPYDQAAFLATHNSMATTAGRFISPYQDPGIIDQLDEGVRALLIDTHTWERPDQIAARLHSADVPADLRAQLPNLIDRIDPPKPGLWLCHVVCRAGAIRLTDFLRALGGWLRANPGEVVTLIIEDAITGQQTQSAFTRAGLLPLLYTPPADPAAPWPTLGEMVHDNTRLVVFAQRTSGPAAWYRKFYDYGMETPFAPQSVAAMTCAPQRGGTGKRLFLLNNFVASAGGSRLGAGEVNTRKFVLDRVHRCEAVRHARVNYVAVDFATIGSAQAAVDELNAERLRAGTRTNRPTSSPSG